MATPRLWIGLLAGVAATVGCGVTPQGLAGHTLSFGSRSVQDTLASKYIGKGSHANPDEVIVSSRTGAPVVLPGAQVIATTTIGGRVVSLEKVLPGQTPAAIVDANRANPSATVIENDLWWAQADPAQPLPSDAYQSMQYGLTKMGVQAAWKTTLGNPDLVVAVVDTGVDYNHPEFAGRMIKGPNFSYRKPDPNAKPEAKAPGMPEQPGPDDPMDDVGHGTHCAGIIAAAADGKGTVGVAPGVKIMAIKVLAGNGGGTTWDVAMGIQYAYTHGARIINLSLGGPQSNGFVELLVADARAHGSLVVAAAGNNGWNLDGPPVSLGSFGQLPHTIYPGMYRDAMAIGATDHEDKLATFSNYGKKVSVVAPGVKILSTMPTGPSSMVAQAGFMKNYDAMSGTSMATPMAVGAAALLMSAHPDWTPDKIQDALERTADVVGPAPFFGRGRINVGKAILQ